MNISAAIADLLLRRAFVRRAHPSNPPRTIGGWRLSLFWEWYWHRAPLSHPLPHPPPYYGGGMGGGRRTVMNNASYAAPCMSSELRAGEASEKAPTRAFAVFCPCLEPSKFISSATLISVTALNSRSKKGYAICGCVMDPGSYWRECSGVVLQCLGRCRLHRRLRRYSKQMRTTMSSCNPCSENKNSSRTPARRTSPAIKCISRRGCSRYFRIERRQLPPSSRRLPTRRRVHSRIRAHAGFSFWPTGQPSLLQPTNPQRHY